MRILLVSAMFLSGVAGIAMGASDESEFDSDSWEIGEGDFISEDVYDSIVEQPPIERSLFVVKHDLRVDFAASDPAVVFEAVKNEIKALYPEWIEPEIEPDDFIYATENPKWHFPFKVKVNVKDEYLTAHYAVALYKLPDEKYRYVLEIRKYHPSKWGLATHEMKFKDRMRAFFNLPPKHTERIEELDRPLPLPTAK